MFLNEKKNDIYGEGAWTAGGAENGGSGNGRRVVSSSKTPEDPLRVSLIFMLQNTHI